MKKTKTKEEEANSLQKRNKRSKGVKSSLADEGKATLKAMDERHEKYIKALEKALQEGAKYEDLLKMDPKDYGLPTQWVIDGSDRGQGRNQYACILQVIAFEFLLDEPSGPLIAPNPRSVAEEMEAPYSVIMDAYNFVNDYF